MNAKNSSVLRITANICFYFTILCVFDAIRGMRLALAVFVALCFALGFVAVRCKNAWLRLLLGLLPALAFLLAELKFALVFPAAAAVYYAAVMCSGRFAVPLDEYRRSFSIQLALALFFIGANIVDTTLFKAKHVSPESLVFVVLFLLLGVYTMRTQQMGASMSGKWLASNLLTIVGFPTLAVGVSTALFLLLRFSEPVLSLVFRPLGTFLSWLMMKLFPSKVEEFVVPPTPGMSKAATR